MKLFYIGFIILCFMFGMYYYDYQDTVQHEKAHEQIAKYFGCTEGYMNISFTDRSYYKCLNYTERPESAIINEMYLHSYNEIIDYNNTRIIHSLYLGFLCLIVTIAIMGFKNDSSV